MRVITGAIRHETNTFSNVPTTLEAYRQSRLSGGILLGDAITNYYRNLRQPQTAFQHAAAKEGWDLIPAVWAECEPAGKVTREAFDYLVGEFLNRVRAASPVDAILMDLHGAMVLEDNEDGDGEFLTVLRDEVGPAVPIVATLDWHGNATRLMVEKADVLLACDTYPHLDTYDRGVEAAHILSRMFRGEIHPVMALAQPPLLVPLAAQFSGAYPMKELVDLVHEVEKQNGIICASIAPGFAYSDIKEAGLSFIVIADGDRRLADAKAKKLADAAWKLRDAMIFKGTPVADAVARAARTTEGPLILADLSDCMGAGCPTDGTVLLAALLEAGAKDVVIATIRDPESVRKAQDAGVGQQVTLAVGGKTDGLHGQPVQLTGTVTVISDGKFINKGPWGKGAPVDMGPTVVVRSKGIEVILTDRRIQPSDPEAFRSLGIEPSQRKILVMKSISNYRAAFSSIAKEIIEVMTPGIGSPDLTTFTYRRVRRPIFPLDPLPW